MKMKDLIAEKKEKYGRLTQVRIEKKTVCPKCAHETAQGKLKKNNYICEYCGYYFPMPPSARIGLFGDYKRKFREFHADMSTKDPLDFPEYAEKLETARAATGRNDAVVTGVMLIKDIPIAVAVMDARFMMGSMGTVVGEKITALTEFAALKKLPLVIFSASGGARMQEGLFSLMQMAKTSAAIEKYKRSGGLYISCLTNPTTGGVSASFAALGDIIISEPGALICFAGPRVIEQTIGRKLPEGFQRAEFLSRQGMIDIIAERKDLKNVICRILKLHGFKGAA